jgi:tetratricopeptide (TPR) repeat protein
MRRWLDGSGSWVAFTVPALLCGLALLAASAWLRPLEQGHAAAEAGRLDEARERFAAAEARFDRVPLAKRLLPSAYAAAQVHLLWVLYRLDDRDALLEKAAVAVPSAPVHFWSACALFSRAMEEVEPQARVGWLDRASEEFRKALALAPEDWDTKYNYELTERLLAQLRKEPQTPPKELLRLLRPRPRQGRAPARRTG